MNMGTSSMDMGSTSASSSMSMSGTATTAASATSTAMSMSSMDMGGACKISMLWNWYTVDACFISQSWHITSKGMFAGSCIGVILLVVALEALRRLSKDYDSLIVRQHLSKYPSTPALPLSGSDDGKGPSVRATASSSQQAFRPSVLQQAVRALLHMLQFAVAYFVMLLAMYYNGYIIICILIGAYIGAFIFSWQSINIGKENTNANEVTYCCG